MKFGTENITDIPTSFIRTIILFDEALRYGAMVRKFEVILGETLNHSV
jgi:hypothetical protein